MKPGRGRASTWSLHAPIALSGGNGALFFFIPCSGGADSQFAQMWNWYGRGIVETCRRENRTREMKEENSGGFFPQTCDRRSIMVPSLRGGMLSWFTAIAFYVDLSLGPSSRGGDRNYSFYRITITAFPKMTNRIP